MTNFTTIPTVSMTELDQYSPHAIQKFHHICHQVGFFYLKNHGISLPLMQNVLNYAKEFFALPQHEKDTINIAHSPHFRGYGRLNAEITQGIPDFKETYDLGLETPASEIVADKAYTILHGPNQWPNEKSLIHFKTIITQYIHLMQHLGLRVMRAISCALNFNECNLDKMFSPNSEDAYALLRLLHYPSSQHLLGVGPHTDAGFLVFLLQDNTGGLEVQNSSGTWIPATPKAGTFVVNIGEMLEAWSNGLYRATRHRVINTSQQPRYSAPFFYEPHLSYEAKPGVIYGERILAIYQRSYPT